MDDIRKRFFIIVSIFAGLILAVVLFLIFYNKPRLPVGSADDVQTTLPANSGAISNQHVGGMQKASGISIPAKPAIASEEVYVKQLAGIFIERFLSYSNQNSNQHIEDTASLATDKMASWIKKQAVEWSMEYQGSLTKVVASQLKEISKNGATVDVEVQQIFDGKDKKTVYRSGKVELLKIGSEWKVDGFYWE